MSLAIRSPDDMAKRRPRRKQEPSLAVTEGRVSPVAKVRKSARRIGRGGHTEAERLQVQDEEIEKLDAECRARWEISAITGLCESQVYRRLKRLRDRRKLYRAVQAVMDDTTLYG